MLPIVPAVLLDLPGWQYSDSYIDNVANLASKTTVQIKTCSAFCLASPSCPACGPWPVSTAPPPRQWGWPGGCLVSERTQAQVTVGHRHRKLWNKVNNQVLWLSRSSRHLAMLMRRGHRLHSLAGGEHGLDMAQLRRLETIRWASPLSELVMTSRYCRQGEIDQEVEAEVWEAVQTNDVEIIKRLRNRTDSSLRDLPFMQAVIGEAIGLGNTVMVTEVVDLFAHSNQHAYQVCSHMEQINICI